ncbi:hypothetical protein [Haloferax sulfurifontis]|uniref:Uncharacterized protein n=1 Tax=Haloferax sulfurifontis TaxID=255616 RepID=A0A830E3F7_9EURY|nr:hypothetical protein [Haloferax sulfurifontis]GGC49747.1 hypothetical protein GCM10007209_09250 [Haloferax sulfurifontis]
MPALDLSTWDKADRLDSIRAAARRADVDCTSFVDGGALKLIIGDESLPNSWLASDTWVDARDSR